MTPDQLRESLVRRFWSKVVTQDGCWSWAGSTNANGYAVIWNGANMVGAHRVSYEIYTESRLSADELVCHSCDNPVCTNPGHLWIGSHDDNMLDMKQKGRAKIESCGRGHVRSGANLYVRPDGKGTECRQCRTLNSGARLR